MKFWRGFAVLSLALAIFAGASGAIPRSRTERELRQFMRLMESSGERIALPSLDLPDQNLDAQARSADFSRTIQLLRVEPFVWTAPALMHGTCGQPGAPLWTLPSWHGTEGQTLAWDAVRDKLRSAEPNLRSLREFLANPPPLSGINYASPSARPPGFRLLQIASSWLQTALVCDLHDADYPSALANLHALLGLARLYDSDRSLVLQIIRCEIIHDAQLATAELLQSAACQQSDLNDLRCRWEAIEILPAFVPALELERALRVATFEAAREHGLSRWSTVPEGANPWTFVAASSVVGPSLWKAVWSYQDEQNYLSRMQTTIDLFRQASKNAGKGIGPVVLSPSTSITNKQSCFDSARLQLSHQFLFDGQSMLKQVMTAQCARQSALDTLAVRLTSDL